MFSKFRPAAEQINAINSKQATCYRESISAMDVKKGQISSLVDDGMNGLRQLLTSFADGGDSAGATAVESSVVRFKLWAGSLGAHRASGSRSLQYRLRDASSIRTLVVSLLEDLNRLVLREGA